MEQKNEFRDHVSRMVLEDMLNHPKAWSRIRKLFRAVLSDKLLSAEAERFEPFFDCLRSASKFFWFVSSFVAKTSAETDQDAVRRVVVVAVYETAYRTGYVFTEEDSALLYEFSCDSDEFDYIDYIFNVVKAVATFVEEDK